jgi:hypothetical protein
MVQIMLPKMALAECTSFEAQISGEVTAEVSSAKDCLSNVIIQSVQNHIFCSAELLPGDIIAVHSKAVRGACPQVGDSFLGIVLKEGSTFRLDQ